MLFSFPLHLYISTFLFWLGLCLFCFDFRGFLHVLAIFLPLLSKLCLSPPPLTHFSVYSTFFNDTFAWIFVRVIYFFITFIIVQGFNFRPKRIYSIDVKISIFFFIDKSFIKSLNILSSMWYCDFYLIKSFVFTTDKINRNKSRRCVALSYQGYRFCSWWNNALLRIKRSFEIANVDTSSTIIFNKNFCWKFVKSC